MYIRKNPNSSGAYPAPQSNYAEGLLVISEEFLEVFFQYNGFVLIEEVYKRQLWTIPNIWVGIGRTGSPPEI